MSYFHKIFIFGLSFLILSGAVLPAFGQEKITVYFFKAEGCPHCAKEKIFLDQLKLKNTEIEIKEFELVGNKNNQELLQKIAKSLSINIPGVPATFIGSHYFFGYQNDETSGALVKQLIEEHKKEKCEDIVAPILDEFQKQCALEEQKSQLSIPEKISLPLFGEIKIKNFSLPVLTVIIGSIDGFNPCAMWVLLFLISLLLGMKNRKRMWLLGGTFILTSALVYFLFLTAWLNFFLFIGFIYWIRLVVGLGALIMGGYYLKNYFTNKADVCQIEESEKKQKIIERLKNSVQKEKFIFALAGIVVLAAVVNLFELLCSIGLPAIYTNILSLSDLSTVKYYLYLLLYIFFFMLDDMVVFIIAMVTLKAVGMTKKYSRYSALIGGILILIIGVLLLFKPAWLMFG